jgi:pullulanase
MKKNISSALALVLLVLISACVSVGGSALDAEPGTIENKSHPKMDLIVSVSEQINPADDEVVLYYYRPDGDYEPWGFWLWAPGEGDGSLNFDFSSQLSVIDGVGYFKFKKDGSDIGQSAINLQGEIGFIRRADDGWDGQTKDMVWNVETKGNEVVYIEGSPEPIAVGSYKPSFLSVIAVESNILKAELSGKHALSTTPDDNGFMLEGVQSGRMIEIANVTNARMARDPSKNYSSTIYFELAEDLPVDETFQLNHPAYLAAERVDASKIILAAIDSITPAMEYEMGALYSNGSVEFRVWSPFAQAVTARLFSTSIAENRNALPDYIQELNFDESTGVWSGVFNQVDPEGLYYDYLILHPNGEKDALDPYARSMDAFTTVGDSGRGAIVDLSKALPTGGWQGAESVVGDSYYQEREDAIIYEIHIRDFTISPDSGVRGEKGTYEAFIQKLPYLKELGVTHIQLLPVMNFYYTDETDKSYEGNGTTSNNNYNWGYDPHNWFTPEGWYSSDPVDPYARMIELKNLIKAAHESGMRVLLDTVYNHMGSTNTYEDVVPGYYFRRNANGTFTSNSGVGNDYASTRKMARKLIIDSIVYWVDEYKIDGFRFDLMGLIDTETMLQAYELAREIKPDVLFQGEGWKMYNGPSGTKGMDQNFMTSTDSIAVFNDEIRDLLKAGGFNEEGRGFITKDSKPAKNIFSNLIGVPRANYEADDPGDSMTYIAAHDGLTLRDSIVHNARIRTGNDAGDRELIQRIKLGNFMVLTGQSIAFLHGGQERGRSKPNVNMVRNETIGQFVRNSYDSSDNINQIVWTLDDYNTELLEYTKGLIQIRKAFKAFRIGDAGLIAEAAEFIPQEGEFMLSYSINFEGRTFYLLVNAAEEGSTFTLPADLSGAEILVDSVSASADGLVAAVGVNVQGSSVTLDALTATLLVLDN